MLFIKRIFRRYTCHPVPCYLNSHKVFLLWAINIVILSRDSYLRPKAWIWDSALDHSATMAGFLRYLFVDNFFWIISFRENLLYRETVWMVKIIVEMIEFFAHFSVCQTLANNSTPPRYSKNIWYSAIIRGRIVGQIVAQYLTRGRVEYLYFRRIWWIVVE